MATIAMAFVISDAGQAALPKSRRNHAMAPHPGH